MAKVTLGKVSFDLTDSIASGDVAKALKDAASAMNDYAKTGNSEPFRKLLDKILKTAIPNDLKKAKDDKEAKACLQEVKKNVETIQSALDTISTVEKGKP
jgi:uncharacterized UPF0160 family protein